MMRFCPRGELETDVVLPLHFYFLYAKICLMDDIIIVAEKISKKELKQLAEKRFGDLVKAVVDINRGVMAVGGELHADEEAALLNDGSSQQDLWGINIYPDEPEEKQIEFDSMINIRPSQGNHSRDVGDMDIRKKIIGVVKKLAQ